MPHLSPQTLTQDEQRAILRATARNLRDHLIYSLAFGTGLRLAEIVGLDVGDVYTPDGKPRNRVRLRPEIAKNGTAGDVFLPDALLAKFRRFWRHKVTRREGLRPGDPLFCNQSRARISPRRVQFAFRTWQVKAGFDRLYPFHALRHTAVTNVYRASRDLFLAQRFARHVSPLTTTLYTHPSDQEMWEKVRRLSC
ncbi:MAG TPA: site-specific integrase [Candidatus Polarisedimenticolia bacterium]|jgi:integrase|nr:site-specific integrase [Nitrospirales bacterium]HEV8701819.1 site-specific integrase [Candidatus Polarisedimenticolia bacterium]